MPDRDIFGYEIIRKLGEGAGSRIYAVRPRNSSNILAMKHVTSVTKRSARFIDQLTAEYHVGNRVRHPMLRGIVERHVTRRFYFGRVTEAALIMEMIDGQSLADDSPRRLGEILRLFEQVAQPLLALHAAGYVHCDLKPGNIMRCADGRVKVIDLGQACKIGAVKPRIQGTPDYISPEQVHCRPVTAQTDIYNFGTTLYWALTGEAMPTLFRMKKGDNDFFVDTQLRTPSELNPHIPQPVSDFVMHCVRTNPAKRPADMRTVIASLVALQTRRDDIEAPRSVA